jgi:hypothetical protein
MKRHLFGTVSALLVVGMMAGCATDPTKDLRGGVVTVLVSRTYVDLNVGQVLRMNAKALDAQGNVLPILPTISTSDAAIVSVTIDDTTSGDPLPETDFQIAAVSPGSVEITATAGGVTSTPTTVVSYPLVFDGTVAVDQTGLQDVITISATAAVTFDPAATTVTVNDIPVGVISLDANSIVVAVTNTGALTGGTVTLNNLVFLGSIDLATLDASTLVDTRASPMTTDFASAPNWTAGPFPMTVYVYIDGTDPDVHAMFLPAADLALTVDADWETDADVDLLWLNSGGSVVSCGSPSGCTGAHPEQSVYTVAAGATRYLDINLYDGVASVVKVVISN